MEIFCSFCVLVARIEDLGDIDENIRAVRSAPARIRDGQ